ncbi:MAG: hypothetical protein HKN19_03550 [Halioglobus sp.]|nr:hypothetical protein [Halioglobus sp.]
MRTILVLVLITFVAGCNHPLEIIGEGDILSASGNRDCLLADARAGAANCVNNTVSGDYQENYFAVAHRGWEFHRWANYCSDPLYNDCSFDVPAHWVQAFAGVEVPALVAIFREVTNVGLESLFIGHSFFIPYAIGMNFHAENAGFEDHTQESVFAGGAGGAPEALWNNDARRARIQGVLDGGNIELFGMTYFPTYPSMTGYYNWVDYALERNPDTRFFIAMPWEPYPANTSAATYESNWELFHPAISHSIVDDLRGTYPGVDFFCVPYGQAAVELRKLFAADNLPDVEAMLNGPLPSIFNDALGHADDILVDLGELVWLRALYDVDLTTYSHDPGYITDLKAIATHIMDGHDPAYDAPYH